MKKTIFVLLILSVLLITGCAQSGGNARPDLNKQCQVHSDCKVAHIFGQSEIDCVNINLSDQVTGSGNTYCACVENSCIIEDYDMHIKRLIEEDTISGCTGNIKCFAAFAIAKNDDSYCESEIMSDPNKLRCYEMLGYDKHAACDAIYLGKSYHYYRFCYQYNPAFSEERCKSFLNEDKDQCYMEWGVAQLDYELCRKAGTLAGKCDYWVAMGLNDASKCGELETAQFRDNCFEQVS